MGRGKRRHLVRVVEYGDRNCGLRYVDAAGRDREVSAETRDRREAERAAARLEASLAEVDSPAIAWERFRQRYEDEALAELSKRSYDQWRTAANRLEAAIRPRRLADVNKSSLSRWVASMQADGLAAASIRSYLATVKAALGWAADIDLIDRPPRVRLRRLPSGNKRMRSRPVTWREFQAIAVAAARVQPGDAGLWVRFMLGLWHSGLRVDELRRLSWDPDADLSISLEFPRPLIRMLAAGHKSRQNVYQPVTPEFWGLLNKRERVGFCFPLPGRFGGQRSADNVCRTIARFGREADVVTDAVSGKTATSHDIGRRAFLTRMDRVLSVAELQKWARHASAETTLSFYHHRSALELSERVWQSVAIPVAIPGPAEDDRSS